MRGGKFFASNSKICNLFLNTDIFNLISCMQVRPLPDRVDVCPLRTVKVNVKLKKTRKLNSNLFSNNKMFKTHL